MAHMYLHIKGGPAVARAALDAHGINLVDRFSPITTHEGMSGLYVALECEPGVVRWFCEPAELVMGFGYPDGTLLHYTIDRE